MKIWTLLWSLIMALAVAVFLVPLTREYIIQFTTEYPYAAGFIKFAILATMGELLVIRLTSTEWHLSKGFVLKTVIWGVIGMMITLFFQLYAAGVSACMTLGFLPGGNNTFLFALFTSILMNLTFGIVFMAFHRVSDTYIEMRTDHINGNKLMHAISDIDWSGFITFVVFRSIPFFWIPAHTITFMLPQEYRVIAAAFLSIALGVLLTFAKTKSG